MDQESETAKDDSSLTVAAMSKEKEIMYSTRMSRDRNIFKIFFV